MKRAGWILDVYVEEEGAVVWLLAADGPRLKLTDRYRPFFRVLPKEGFEREVFNALAGTPNVADVRLEEKRVNLEGEKGKLIAVTLDGLGCYGRIVGAAENAAGVKGVYDADLLHVQKYVFTRLGVAPTGKVEVEHEGGRLVSAKPLDDSSEVAPPPFTVLSFCIEVEGPFQTRRAGRDPVASITARCGEEAFKLDGEEPEVLEGFQSLVREKDPDFLVCPECDGFTLPHLFARARVAGIDLRLGRDGGARSFGLGRNPGRWAKGRVVLGRRMPGLDYEEWGLAGLVERSRFSLLPPGIAGRWTANKVIDSRNCYELLRRGYAIPRNVGRYEYARTMKEVVARDRGGCIISPKAGIHENVAELDFESQYPNLIVKHNLSYETVTPEGIEPKEGAILPYVTKAFLERRLRFKRLKKDFPEKSAEREFCEQRQQALKSILVCLYGTSGCCWNRFGNVLCFEEINRRSREAMMAAKDCAQAAGFEVVYGDTDSIFVRREGASKEDYEGLAQEIGRRTGLPIALDHHYKFLALLPLESDPSGSMEAQKRYFGILTNGELVARGIEARRHDTPRFIARFQRDLILALFDCENLGQVRTVGYARARKLAAESARRVMDGEVPAEDLVVSKILGRPLRSYSRAAAHVSAAVRLAERGRVLGEGEVVRFVHVDSKNRDPLRRVSPIETFGGMGYDREKYRDLLLGAAEAVLSTLGFSRLEFSSEKGEVARHAPLFGGLSVKEAGSAPDRRGRA
ncbi:MAG: hypothetical protein JTT11_04505 [Candidatus Brockarchaeota archaeon]|nr:hypothetical protein [Candidatus Brockarchaeota archaeon]